MNQLYFLGQIITGHYFSNMKKFNFSLIALLFGALSIAQTNEPQATRIVRSATYSFAVPLSNESETFYYLRPDRKIDFEETNNWSGTNFGTRYSHTYHSYNMDGRVVERLQRLWDSAQQTYVDCCREQITYDQSGNPVETVKSNLVGGVWVKESSYTNTYTPLGDVLSQTWYYYKPDGSANTGYRWFNTLDTSYRATESVNQEYQNGNFVNQSRTVFQYIDADKVADYQEISYWNTNNNTWYPVSERITRTATPQQVVVLSERNNGSSWNPTNQVTTDYDSNGLITSFLSEQWEAATQSFRALYGGERMYNADMSLHRYKGYQKDFQTGTYFQTLQLDYEYGLYTSAQTPVLQVEAAIFPNPTTDRLEVRLKHSMDDNTRFNYTLTDGNGRVVERHTHVGAYAVFSMQQLSAGIYFLQVEDQGAVKTLPVVKM